MKRELLIIICLAVLAGALYLPVLSYPFLWDDEALIVRNVFIRNFSSWPRLFIHDLHFFGGRGNYYRPLVGISFALNYQIRGLNPFGYHLTNILLHLLNAFLVYRLLHRLGAGPGASLAAGLFLAHPLFTAAVTYISGRADLLATSFMLAGLLIVLRNRGSGSPLLPLACFILALLSKEMAIIFPLLLLWTEQFYPKKARGRFRRRYLIPAFLIAAFYILLRGTILNFSHSPHYFSSLDLGRRLIAVPVLLVDYLKLFFFPLHLHMLRWPRLPTSCFNLRTLTAGGLVISLGIVALARRRSNPRFFQGLLWFLICLFPVLNLFPLSARMAEHWLYLPSIGLFLALSTVIFPAGAKQEKLRKALVLGIIFCLLFLTSHRNRDWRNKITIYRQTLEASELTLPVETGPRRREERERRLDGVHNNLGNALAEAGRRKEAVSEFKAALRINPRLYQAHHSLGTELKTLGRYREGLEAYQEALKIQPDSAETCQNLGNLYRGLGMFQPAEDWLKKAVRIDPYLAEAYSNLAIVYVQEGYNEKAIRFWEKALEIDPRLDSAQVNLRRAKRLRETPPAPEEAQKFYRQALALEKRGRLAEAINTYREAISLNPREGRYHNDLGRLYRSGGKTEAAIEEYREALQVDKSLAEPHVNLANIYLELGFYPEAEAECEQAAANNPELAAAYNTWGRALGESGDLPGAITKWEKALQLDPSFTEAKNNLRKAKRLLP